MELKFNLQLFAATTVPGGATGVSYMASGGTAWTLLSATMADDAVDAVAFYDGSTYWIKSENAVKGDLNGSVKLMTGTVTITKGTDGAPNTAGTPEAAAGTVGIDGTTNTVTTDNAGTLTFDGNGNVSGASDTGALTVAGTVPFKGFDGQVYAKDKKGTYTASSFTGSITDEGAVTMTNGTVVTSDDYIKTTSGNVIGAVFNGKATFTTSDGESFTATLDGSAQEIDIAAVEKSIFVTGSAGADNFLGVGTAAKATIDGGAGSDTITTAATNTVSIYGGAGDDTIDATAVAKDSTLLGGAGKDSIKVGGEVTGLFVDAGDDNDEVVVVANTVTKSTIRGGAGDDKLTSLSETNTIYGDDGKDTFDISTNTAKVNIADYKFGEDLLGVGAGAVAVANGLEGKLKFDGKDGFIAVNGANNGAATITSSEGFFAATLVDGDKDKANVAWVGDSPVTVDASGQTIQSVIFGTTNKEGDLIYGSQKSDTIYAGSNDSVYGGAGSDTVTMAAGTYGVYVGLSTAGGADEVKNFSAEWDLSKADALYMMDGTAEDLKVANTGANITLKSGSATMTLTGAGAATEAKLLINDKKVDVIASGKEAVVTDDSTIADYYIGTEKSGIDMTKYTGDVQVDLSNDMFRNIATLKAGSGNMSVLGGKAAESLIGGTGATSIYGGAGTDTLVSGKGKTTFFANESSGKDVVTGFVVGTADDSDVINVNNLKSITRADNTNFTVNLDGTNSLKVAQKSGDINSNIQWVSGDASGVVKIGKTATDNKFSYDAATTNYYGSTKTDVVSVKSGTADSFNVWLDQTGDMFISVEGYDFSQTSGDVLAAGKANVAETIVGGKGTSSLWGGTGATKDVLVNKNSSATAEFFYGMGDGNDEIQGQKGDSVNLYNLSVSDITKATINSNNVVFTTSANETVTVSGSVGTFKLADGSSWTADYSNKSWTQN